MGHRKPRLSLLEISLPIVKLQKVQERFLHQIRPQNLSEIIGGLTRQRLELDNGLNLFSGEALRLSAIIMRRV